MFERRVDELQHFRAPLRSSQAPARESTVPLLVRRAKRRINRAVARAAFGLEQRREQLARPRAVIVLRLQEQHRRLAVFHGLLHPLAQRHIGKRHRPWRERHKRLHAQALLRGQQRLDAAVRAAGNDDLVPIDKRLLLQPHQRRHYIFVIDIVQLDLLADGKGQLMLQDHQAHKLAMVCVRP